MGTRSKSPSIRPIRRLSIRSFLFGSWLGLPMRQLNPSSCFCFREYLIGNSLLCLTELWIPSLM